MGVLIVPVLAVVSAGAFQEQTFGTPIKSHAGFLFGNALVQLLAICLASGSAAYSPQAVPASDY